MKVVVTLLIVCACAFGCGDDDALPPPGGAGGFGGVGAEDGGLGGVGGGGSGGSGGIGGSDRDAQVGVDSAVPRDVGTLTVSLNDITDMSGKNVLIEVISIDTNESVAGACVEVTSDSFDAEVEITSRISPGLCDYSQDTGVPIGRYAVSVQIQEPEVFPAIRCASAVVTIELGSHAEVSFDTYPPCSITGLPDGIYDGSALRCESDSERLEHSSIKAAARLLDFADTTMVAERDGMSWIETYEDSDCRMQLTRQIVEDVMSVGFLTFSATRSFEWTPSDCTFTATAGAASEEIGANYAYYATTEQRPDDFWFYVSTANVFTFSSIDGVWSLIPPGDTIDLSCATDEAIVRTWTRR